MKKNDTGRFTETIMCNLKRLRENNDEFYSIFKLKLSDFWINNLIGFDIVKFDDVLSTPDGVSLKEHIRSLYGNDAVTLIERLIGRGEKDEKD